MGIKAPLKNKDVMSMHQIKPANVVTSFRATLHRNRAPSSIGDLSGQIATEEQGSYLRLKGFHTKVIENHGDSKKFLDELGRHLESLGDHAGQPSRLCIRAVINDRQLSYLNNSAYKQYVEAVMPIKLRRSQVSYSIVYFGHTTSIRGSYSSAEREYHWDLITTSSERRDPEILRSFLRTESDGFTVKRIEASRDLNPRQTETVNSFLATFGYNESDTNRILNSERYLILAAFQGAVPVGISMGEWGEVELNGGPRLKIAEITNGFTQSGYKNNGIYATTCSNLIKHLTEISNIDVIYSESVIKRSSLLEVIGMQYREVVGVMPLNSYLDEELHTMAVTHLPRDYWDIYKSSKRE